MKEENGLGGKEAEEWRVDVLIAGSGAGGLAAAVTAAYHGLKVVVVERSVHCGGATARSGGWAWAPGNPLAKADGVDEPRDDFRAYLKAVLGGDYQEERIEAFLEQAPHMVGFFERNTSLRFTPGAKICDIYGKLPGAGTGHRSVAATPFYAGELSAGVLAKLPDQYRMTSFWGMGIMAGADLTHFLHAMKKPRSMLYAARRLGLHAWDKVRHGRNMQLVNGLALIARLLQSAERLGVRIETECALSELVVDGAGRVGGAYVDWRGQRVRVVADKGVVLATGGYAANAELCQRTFPRAPDGQAHRTLAPPEADGAGLALAEQAGGYLDNTGRSPAAWCPVSLVRFRDGEEGVFPHIADRAKPGVIAVLQNGRRFVNEANGYYDFVSGLLAAVSEHEPATCWLIGDKRAVRAYMFGFAKPRPVPLWLYTDSLGYLKQGRTLAELAGQCGIDEAGLLQTVAEFNRQAEAGKDPLFGRGETAFNRSGGDAGLPYPNPSLAPLRDGPYFAVRVQVGSFGTFAGIAVNARSQVMRQDGSAVVGLYAVGMDQKSVFGGHYPCGGINIGPALTFGYSVARQLAGVDRYEDDGSLMPSPDYQGTALLAKPAEAGS